MVKNPGGDASLPTPNATVQGTARDMDTGLPLANTDLEFVSGFNQETAAGIYRARTDANGQFTVAVYAYQRSGGFPSWREISIRRAQPVNAPYSMRVVVPRTGETTTVDVTLPTSRAGVSYEAIGSIDLGLAAYAADASLSGNTIATVPFHTESLSIASVEARAKLSVFTASGTLLWQLPIIGATPAVDVSDDGSLIASTRQKSNPADPFNTGGTAILLNRAGTLLLEVAPLSTNDSGWGTDEGSPFMEVRLSHDNKYLALGDKSGRIVFVEVATGRQLWRAFGKGQVRRIDFDLHDERVFISGGDGWLRAYTSSGALLWQSWIGSWATGMEISSRYVLAISKAHRSGLHLIDKTTGVTRWAYQTDYAANTIRIAPDESYVYAASAGPDTHTVFTMDGYPATRLAGSANAAGISADGRYFAYSDGCTMSVVDAAWRALFKSANLADPALCKGNRNYLVGMTPDALSIAVAVGESTTLTGKVVFFKRTSNGGPTSLAASLAQGILTLTWQAPAGESPTGYVVEAGTAPTLTDIASIPLGAAPAWTYAGGVPPGRYYIRVRAQTAAGLTDTSNEVELVAGGSGVPTAPALTGSIVNRLVSLQWSAASGATSYLVEAGSAPGLSDLASLPIASGMSFSYAGVPPGRYFVRVRAINATGSSAPSNELELVSN